MNPMKFDAETLAAAWLSVSTASSDDAKNAPPALYRTVCIEQFDLGVRLVSTDSYMVLRSWVPFHGEEGAPEPDIDRAPQRTAVAIDWHHRGKGLLVHLYKLATAKGALPLDVEMHLDVFEEEDSNEPTLGTELYPAWVVLEDPGSERIRMRSLEGEFPSWRPVVAGFRRTTTDGIALNAGFLERLSKLGKLQHGAPLVWYFGGKDKAAALVIGEVAGLVMPVKWDFERNAPATVAEEDDTAVSVSVNGGPEVHTTVGTMAADPDVLAKLTARS